MRTFFKIFSIFLVGIICQCQFVQAGKPLNKSEHFAIKRGGNLTGFFQYGDFVPARLKELETMKTLGLDFFRLPIEPTRFYDSASPDWQNLETTISTANKLGLSVIVDLHPIQSTQDAALMNEGDPRYAALLTKMAQFLTKFDRAKVALELMNEPIAPITATNADKCAANFDWNKWQAKFYAAARAGAKDLTLVLTGACWGGIDGLLKVKTMTDPNVIYSFHNYDPMLFTHQGASWTGPEQWYLRQMPYPPTPDNVAKIAPTILADVPSAKQRNTYRAQLDDYSRTGFGRTQMAQNLTRAAQWAKRNNARLFLGEFGVLSDNAPPQDRLVWLRDMRETAESLGIAHAVWDFSQTGNFGPYRDGKLEVGVLQALGLTVPADAIATPPNPNIDGTIAANPVAGLSVEIANFNAGSVNNAGEPTQYFTYGKPTEATATKSAPNGAAPIENGQVRFDYHIPANDEFGGVTVVVPTGKINTNQFSHVYFEAAIIGGGKLNVALACDKVDTGGDNPQVSVQADDEMTKFSIPFSRFKQAGWGKAVNAQDVIAALNKIEITAVEPGKRKVKIDNIGFVKMVDASDTQVLERNKLTLLYDFSLTNQQGNAGGAWSNSAYQQNSNSKAETSAKIVNNATGKLLEMYYKLPTANSWAGAITAMSFGNTRNLQDYAALQIDLSATGTQYLRVEFQNTLDTGSDNPQYIVAISPQQKTYRIPIAEFAQAGWGKQINVQQALQNATGVAIYADTVGTQGKVHIGKVLLEAK
jgi:endoglucanase